MLGSLFEEVNKLLVGEIADASPQEDNIVKLLPVVALHRGLIYPLDLRNTQLLYLKLFDGYWALVKAVDLREIALE